MTNNQNAQDRSKTPSSQSTTGKPQQQQNRQGSQSPTPSSSTPMKDSDRR